MYLWVFCRDVLVLQYFGKKSLNNKKYISFNNLQKYVYSQELNKINRIAGYYANNVSLQCLS